MKEILIKSVLFPYVYLRLTAMDLKDLFIRFISFAWRIFKNDNFPRIFGGSTLLFLSLMFFRALQAQDHLPFINIILSVPFSLVLLIISVTILTSKK